MIYDLSGIIQLDRKNGKYIVTVNGEEQDMPSRAFEINPVLAKNFFIKQVQEYMDYRVSEYLEEIGYNPNTGCRNYYNCDDCKKMYAEAAEELPEECPFKGD